MRERPVVVRAVEGSCGSMAGGRVPSRAGVRLIFGSILLACLLLLISSLPARAACRLGLIDSDTTWRRADSPCVVDQGVAVMQGVTLAIEPGVVVKVKTGLAIQIDGTLIARGTSTDSITFTSNAASPAKGDWGVISFGDTSTDATFDASGNYLSGSILEYCTVEYAGSSNSHAVSIARSSPFISHCTIRNNLKDGIHVDSVGNGVPGNPIKIESNEVTGNGGDGIYIYNSWVVTTVSANIVSGNSGNGIYIDNILGTTTLSFNTVTGNGRDGIHVAPRDGITTTVSSNSVTGTTDMGSLLVGSLLWTTARPYPTI